MQLRSRLSNTVAACVLLWATFSAPAQEPTGIISGTITDASGAVVPDATITITNKATGATRNAVANAEGLYSAPALLPGQYEVRVERPGFRTVVVVAASGCRGHGDSQCRHLARSTQRGARRGDHGRAG